jgi:hypothetical protein
VIDMAAAVEFAIHKVRPGQKKIMKSKIHCLLQEDLGADVSVGQGLDVIRCCSVEAVDVRLVMLGVVDLHDLCRDVRFQSLPKKQDQPEQQEGIHETNHIVRIRQCRKSILMVPSHTGIARWGCQRSYVWTAASEVKDELRELGEYEGRELHGYDILCWWK